MYNPDSRMHAHNQNLAGRLYYTPDKFHRHIYSPIARPYTPSQSPLQYIPRKVEPLKLPDAVSPPTPKKKYIPPLNLENVRENMAGTVPFYIRPDDQDDHDEPLPTTRLPSMLKTKILPSMDDDTYDALPTSSESSDTPFPTKKLLSGWGLF